MYCYVTCYGWVLCWDLGVVAVDRWKEGEGSSAGESQRLCWGMWFFLSFYWWLLWFLYKSEYVSFY